MTPLQTLVLIKTDLDAGHLSPMALGQLLADVDLPAPELINLNDPELWTREWSKRHQGPSEATVYAWFAGAMSTAYRAGESAGRAEGMLTERQQRTSAHQLMVARLQLVLSLLADGRLRNLQLRGDTEGAPPQSLAALVEQAIQASEAL